MNPEDCATTLNRIQDLFPSDNLGLNDKDPVTPKCKTLARKRSLTASRLQRALSGSKIKSPQSDCVGESEWCTTLKKKKTLSRAFLLDCPVRLTAGVQCQERHLFLFTDLLLIAKARSTGNYKLKEAVRICELWIADCVDQVAEVSLPRSASFVIGWPTTNVALTFSCTHSRDIWLEKLNQLVEEATAPHTQLETTTIRVSCLDFTQTTKSELVRSATVSWKETAEETVDKLLEQLQTQKVVKGEYQLWVKCGEDGTPYPLVGHERPFAIKMSCLRAAGAEDAFDLNNINNNNNNRRDNVGHHLPRLCFTLRRARTASFHLVPPKKNKRIRRAPILQKVFRRTSSKLDSLDALDTVDHSGSEVSSLCQPFSALSLSQDGHLNKTVMAILTELFHKGPYTQGIFRKSANTRARRELCRKLECEPSCNLSGANAILLSAVVTDILRGQRDCLLSSGLYQKWLDSAALTSDAHKRREISRLLDQLPSINVLFLKHFVCVLWHIAQKSSENMMTATNLARCVGPSFLWPKSSVVEPSKQASQCISLAALVEFLIVNCRDVFGEDCLGLFSKGVQQASDPVAVPRETARCDSGHEESDSLHSTPSSQDSGGLRRDDSSIDSLENVLMSDTEKLAAANASLTNLSRDSGLTMSDTQLYTPDEEAEAPRDDPSPARSYPHSAGKEVIKRRVSRVRTWGRPSSSYFADPDNCNEPREDAPVSGICKSTSEESLLDDRPYHHYHYSTLKPLDHRSRSMYHFENGPQVRDDWRMEEDYGSPGNCWEVYSASPKRPTTRTRSLYEASVRVYNEDVDAEMHHAAPARVESSHSEEEEEDDFRNCGLRPPPLPPKPGEARRSYLNESSVVHIGGKSVVTAATRSEMMSPRIAVLPARMIIPSKDASLGSCRRKEGLGRVAATMSKATSLMAAVGREIGLRGVGAPKSSAHGYSSSTARRVKCRPSLSLSPQGVQGNPPPYRHPPVAQSMSEGPWRTLRSRGVTVHQWQPRRYQPRPAEESYV